MDDRQVLDTREDDVVTSDAYLLLYQWRHESSSFDTVTSHEEFFPMESSTPLPPNTPVFNDRDCGDEIKATTQKKLLPDKLVTRPAKGAKAKKEGYKADGLEQTILNFASNLVPNEKSLDGEAIPLMWVQCISVLNFFVLNIFNCIIGRKQHRVAMLRFCRNVQLKYLLLAILKKNLKFLNPNQLQRLQKE